MIRFRASTDKGTVIGLGLSRENVNRLTGGQPLRVPLRSIGIDTDDWILVFFGETEKEMSAEMRRLGLVTDDTEQHFLGWPPKKEEP